MQHKTHMTLNQPPCTATASPDPVPAIIMAANYAATCVHNLYNRKMQTKEYCLIKILLLTLVTTYLSFLFPVFIRMG